MSYFLRNQNDPNLTMGLNAPTWYGILEMAEDFGWNPMGTITPEWEIGFTGTSGGFFGDFFNQGGNYWGETGRLVVIDDALNFSDALELAFVDYEPVHIPRLNYYMMFGNNEAGNGFHPSLGAIQKVIDFCQYGAFHIERK